MNKMLLLISLMLFVSCKGSDSPASVSSCQSPFQAWNDNGGVGLDLTNIELNTIKSETVAAGNFGISVSPTTQCNIQVTATGNNCSGEINVITSALVNPAAGTTACTDIRKTFSYKMNDVGIVFGIKGTSPIQYH